MKILTFVRNAVRLFRASRRLAANGTRANIRELLASRDDFSSTMWCGLNKTTQNRIVDYMNETIEQRHANDAAEEGEKN